MSVLRSHYLFADYIPLEARQAAVARVYRGKAAYRWKPRDVDGFCPIGICLVALGLETEKTPPASWATNSLADYIPPGERVRVRRSIERFISSWDHGVFASADLPLALGLTRPATIVPIAGTDRRRG